MADPMQRLGEVPAPLGESSEFLAWGTLPPVLPGLEVDGVGPIGVPVSGEDAQRLIAETVWVLQVGHLPGNAA